MEILNLLKSLKTAEKTLGFSSRQFSGAVCVNLLKSVIQEQGISTSEKDVFIQDIPIEVDLLIVKPNSKPLYGLLWKPEDVIAALEVKKAGTISEDGIVKTNSDFGRIRTYHPHIKLLFVTFSEIRSKVSMIKRSDESFTFFIRRNGKYSATGDYERFLSVISELKPLSSASFLVNSL